MFAQKSTAAEPSQRQRRRRSQQRKKEKKEEKKKKSAGRFKADFTASGVLRFDSQQDTREIWVQDLVPPAAECTIL